MPLPNLVLAGPPKCGTSSCFYWLCEHPEVCGSRPKEPWYLIDNKEPGISKYPYNYHQYGIEGYKKFFTHCGNSRVIIEATTGYLYQQTAAEVLSKLCPQPHIIFILREPASRIFSVFRFNKYRTKRAKDCADFREFLRQVREREAKGEVSAIKQSTYIHFLEKWDQAFPRSKLHFFLFEDLKRDPCAFMKKMSTSLSIDEQFWDNLHFPHRNPSVQIRAKWLHHLGKKMQEFIPPVWQKHVFLPLYYKLNAGPLPAPTAEDRQLAEDLRKYFQPYNKQLAQQFNLDLSAWEKSAAES